MSRFPITMLLIALPAFAASAQPRVVLPVQSHNFGHVENTVSIEHRFEVQNQGDEPLQIGRLRACCGVTTEITATDDDGIAIQTVPEANGYRLEINNLIAHQDSEPQSIFITTDREDARHISVPIRIVAAAPERKQPE